MWISHLSGSPDLPGCAAVWDSAACVWPASIGAALVTVALEEKLVNDGTEEERQNLNV